jgi:hypothetical protein
MTNRNSFGVIVALVIAAGSSDRDGSCLYVGDIGNNSARRTRITIYRPRGAVDREQRVTGRPGDRCLRERRMGGGEASQADCDQQNSWSHDGLLTQVREVR